MVERTISGTGSLDALMQAATDGTFEEVKLDEVTPELPLEWTLPASVDREIRLYKDVLDGEFPEISGSELGFVPLAIDGDPTNVVNIDLFHQLVSPEQVLRSEDSALELYRRIESGNTRPDQELNIEGIIHFHPGGIPGPSIPDLTDFKKVTWWNMDYQNLFGWVDVTDAFGFVPSEEGVRSALEAKDAAYVSDGEMGKLYFKVRYGYSVFLIYTLQHDEPWIGVGECKKYCFDGGPKSYRLLTREDGIGLRITEDDGSNSPPDMIRENIARYVRPAIPPQPKRSVMPPSVASSQVLYHHPEIVNEIEEGLPVTGQEAFALLGQYLQFEKGEDPDSQAIRRVYALLNSAFKPGMDYDAQMTAATDILRKLSPAYDAARKLHDEHNGGNGGGNR